MRACRNAILNTDDLKRFTFKEKLLFMKNLDPFSRRFLVICLGLSMVFATASLLVFSAKPVHARSVSPIPGNGKINGSSSEIYPMSVHNGTIYFLEFYNNAWQYQSVKVENWKTN